MRRRSKAGGEPAKTRRPKASAPKRRNAPKANTLVVRGYPSGNEGCTARPRAR